MAFRFGLGSVLRYRRSVERKQEAVVQAAHQQLAVVRQRIEEIRQGARTARLEIEEKIKMGIRSAELQLEWCCLHQFELEQQELAKKQEALVDLCRHELDVLGQLRQERERLEILRKRQHALYLEEEKRREQRQADTQFLTRRFFIQRSRNA